MNDTVLKKATSWQMFNDISGRYDFLNHLLSGGLDIYWRHRLYGFIPSRGDQRLLDLATGTGDVIFSLIRKSSKISSACGLDMAEKMLTIARRKANDRNISDKVTFLNGDAQKIPLEDAQFDVVTMAFGIRNTEDPQKVLKEAHRVLGVFGRVLILEFSLPSNAVFKKVYLFYLRNIVPFLGKMFSGNYEAYKYLNETVEEFPHGERFCRLLEEANFRNVKANTLSFGIASIYQGDKV